jgi:hypothetical protein
MKKAWLYITTNLVNGKKYIGQTTSTRKTYMGSGYAIMAAFKKYGKENFVRKNIYEGEWELVDLLEQEFIEKYDAVNSPLYYNQKPGGHTGTHSNVSRKIISEKATGRKASDESKKQRSTRMKGTGNHFFNKAHTEDSIKKIKEKRAQQVITEESNKKRSEKIKSLPKFQCTNCGGWYFNRNLIQYHNEKCKKARII